MSSHLSFGRCALCPPHYLILVGTMMGFASCAAPGTSDSGISVDSPLGGPSLVEIDRILLSQDDRHFVTIPISFAVLDDGSGDFLVSDGRLVNVVRFARDGLPVRSYGATDFAGAIRNTWTVGTWDTTIMIADLLNQRIHHVHSESGELLRSEPFMGRIGVAVSQPRDEQWLGSHQAGASGRLLEGLLLQDLIGGNTIRLDLPEEWSRYPALEVHSGVNVVRSTEGMLVSLAAMEGILRLTEGGDTPDTIVVPRRNRRGVSRRTLEDVGFDRREVVNRTSRLVLMDRNSEGRIVLVHHDARYRTSGGLDVRVWVSLLSEALDYACVDSPLAVPSTPTPNVYFRRDTLWAQGSRVVDGEAVLEVRAFLVDAADCEWLPVARTADLLLP